MRTRALVGLVGLFAFTALFLLGCPPRPTSAPSSAASSSSARGPLLALQRVVAVVPTATGVVTTDGNQLLATTSPTGLTIDCGTNTCTNFPGGGWKDSAFGSGGCDFSADANQTIGSDTTFTVCGFTWTKENSANERAAMAVVNGQGLTIQSGAGKDYGQLLGFADRTAPILKIPFSSLSMTDLSWTSSVKVTVENFSEANAAAFNPDGTMVGIDDCGTTNDAGHFYMVAGGLYGINGAAANHRWFAAAHRGPTATSYQTTTVYSSAPVATFMLYAERLVSATLWPSIYYDPTATLPVAEGNFVPIGSSVDNHAGFWNASSSISTAPQLPTTASSLCLTLAAGETGGGDTFTSVIKKVRVQFRL